MTRHYVLADESGNLDFSRSHGASAYFAIGTLHVVEDNRLDLLRADLLRLKTKLAWAGLHGGAEFGAAEDAQAVRDAVFTVLGRHEVALDVTVFEKSKAQPHLRSSREVFLRHVWRDHFGGLAPLFSEDVDVMVIVSSIGTIGYGGPSPPPWTKQCGAALEDAADDPVRALGGGSRTTGSRLPLVGRDAVVAPAGPQIARPRQGQGEDAAGRVRARDDALLLTGGAPGRLAAIPFN